MEFIQKYNKVDKNNISIDSFNEVEVRGLTLSNEVLIDNSFLDQSLSGYDILQNVTRSKEDTKKDAFSQLDIDDLENNVVDAKITRWILLGMSIISLPNSSYSNPKVSKSSSYGVRFNLTSKKREMLYDP